ncbi:hypothetical protein HDU84_007944 [Entophlyctis sp. JEL0112]|nr:hypothetical protein HDU84_007944 [Entophlyctis sp. JEL0112]
MVGQPAFASALCAVFWDREFSNFDSDARNQRTGDSKSIQYIQLNTLGALPYGDKEFHFVRGSLLFESFPSIECIFLLNELARVAKANSFVQLVEVSSIALINRADYWLLPTSPQADLFAFRRGPISSTFEQLEDHYYGEMQKRGFELFAATNLPFYVKSEGKKADMLYISHRTVSVPLGYGNALERLHTSIRKQMFIRSAEWMCKLMSMSQQEYLDVVDACFSPSELERSQLFTNYACVTFQIGADSSYLIDL